MSRMVSDVTLSMPVPPGWPGAREDDLPDQLRFFLRDHLRDETAKGETQQVDLSKTEGPDEGHCVPRHRLH